MKLLILTSSVMECQVKHHSYDWVVCCLVLQIPVINMRWNWPSKHLFKAVFCLCGSTVWCAVPPFPLQMLATVVVLRIGKMLGVISFPDLDSSIPRKVRWGFIKLKIKRWRTGHRISHIPCLSRCSRCRCCMSGIKYQDCLGLSASSENFIEHDTRRSVPNVTCQT